MTNRELDALVAEKIMGITVTEHDWPCGHGPDGYEAENYAVRYRHDERGPVYKVGGATDYRIPVQFYSSDIAAAWLVQAELHRRGFWMSLKSPFEADTKDWHAGFTPHSCSGWNGRPDHKGSAETAPRAICIAALLAVGCEVAE